jgi:transcriptional regulator with XRE-family HTH domain
MYVNNFGRWINARFMEWEKTTGRRGTVSGFARYLGVKQPSLSRWMNGDADPENENLRKIAKKYGDEVYVILGMDPPDADDFAQFPEPLASHLRAASDEIESLLNSGRFPPNSPEHAEAAREIFKRHGLDLKDIDIEE